MSQNKYTSGLWHFRVRTAGNGKPIVTIDSDVQPEGGLYEICRQYLDEEPIEAVERIKADFHLIAAAPELLEACEELIKECDVCQGEGEIEYQPSGIDGWLPTGDANFIHEDCPRCSKARAAIAKAKGES